MLILTPAVVQQEQILSIDIMFVEQVALLVAVSHPLDLTLGVILDQADSGKPSRTAESVKKYLDVISRETSSCHSSCQTERER